jgi:hypothetical protein
MLSRLLARPWAWWLNKVPLSVTLVLLLVDGAPLGLAQAASLVLVVLIVCAVGNYGYAVNDLFDMEEDRRTGRPNFAMAMGRGRATAMILASALVALALAWAAAGPLGGGLTLAELMLPLAYSVPPVRIKERKWLGIAADGLAAHVYPAALALLTVSHLGAARPQAPVIGCVMAWSAAAGLRGILSHQLNTADRDVQGGLRTVVHDIGRAPLERLVIFALLPVEAAGFIGAAALSPTGPVLWAFGGLYLACEAYRTLDRRFVVRALRPQGQRYLPLVEESFYKAWGPVVIALDAARIDARFLLAPVLYLLLFGFHLKIEARRLRDLGAAIARPSGAR